MLWRNRRQQQTPGSDSPVAAHTTPAGELEQFRPVVRHNHIAYVPAPEFSGVPGVGTANLAYVPDFLLSPPNFFGGNAALRRPNAIMIAIAPVMISSPVTRLEGIGGLTAGQLVHQPLLAVNVDNGSSEVGE